MSIPVGHAGQLGSKATRVESRADLPCGCGQLNRESCKDGNQLGIKAKNLFAIWDSFCCHLAGVTGIVPLTGELWKIMIPTKECADLVSFVVIFTEEGFLDWKQL